MLLTAALFAGVLSAWAALVQFHLRHAGLTVLTLAAPVPVVATGYWLGWGFRIDAAPFYAMFACLFAVVCAQFTSSRIARGICDGLSPRDAVRKALGSVVMPIGTMLAAFALSILLVVAIPFTLKACLAAILLMLAAFAFAIAAGWLARWFPYSEKFIADANAAREGRERLIERLSGIAETRWALSVSGMTIIFAILAAFGMHSLRVQTPQPWMGIRVTAAALIAFVLFALGARNWRLAAAQVLTLAFEAALGLWAFGHGILHVLGDDLVIMSLTIAVSATPLVVLASTVSACLREGERLDAALARALQLDGPGAVLTSIISTIPWLVFIFAGGIAPFQLIAAFASVPGTVVIFPALATTIFALLPRYRSVDEVFGRC